MTSKANNSYLTIRKGVMLAALFTVQFSLLVCPAGAQAWHEYYHNRPYNLHYNSLSPTRLSYNNTRDYGVAEVGYNLQKGDFHNIDKSGDTYAIDATIGGLRQIDAFSLFGHIHYKNEQANHQSWNSTLWLLNDNPFVLCDSVPGDATTESFDMQAAASYAFNNRLKAGILVGLSTGNHTDQNNPRPRTTNSIVPITTGVDYQINSVWNIGLAGGISMSNMIVEYTMVQPFLDTRYFLMKGMGNYIGRSAANEVSYQRNYNSTILQTALNAEWRPAKGCVGNFLEIRYSTASQDATDGGSSYSFIGGEYSENGLSIHNRLQLKPHNRVLHNVFINATQKNGKGIWYDQKRTLDQEHGGVIIYEVLSKNTNYKSKRLTASLGYQLDVLRNDGRRDITVNAQVGMSSLERKQLLGDTTPKQEIQMLNLSLQAGKTLYINKVTLLAQVSGGYQSPQKQTYASGSPYTDSDNIDAVYTRRVFEFESAQSWNIGAYADASLPVGEKLTAGIYAGVRHHAYNGKSEYWQGYDGTHLTTIDAGAYIKF